MYVSKSILDKVLRYFSLKDSFASRSLLLIIVCVLYTLLPSLAMAGENQQVYQIGDIVAGEFKVSGFKKQAEFVRYEFEYESKSKKTVKTELAKTEVEIIYNDGSNQEWSSKLYRVQPSPEANPPERLLKAILADLKTFESQSEHLKIVKNSKTNPQIIEHPSITMIRDYLKTPLAYAVAVFLLLALCLLVIISLLLIFAKIFPILKPLVLWLIIFLPLIVVVLLVVSFVGRISHINSITPNQVSSAIEQRLSVKSGQPMEFIRKNGKLGYFNPYKWYNDSEDIFIEFEPQKYDKLIYLFGGSSVGEPGQKETFAYKLEQRLKKTQKRRQKDKLKLFNFGMNGYDSYSILNRVKATTEKSKPDLLIIYSGHNDYIDQYFYLKNDFGIIKGSKFLYGISYGYYHYIHVFLHKILGSKYFPRYELFEQYLLEPNLLKGLRRAGLISVPLETFKQANQSILKYFKKNIESIINVCKQKNIPLILITPISNLQVEPVGANELALKIYVKAMNEKNYRIKTDLLKNARDLDAFGFMVRVKSQLNQYLRSLNQPGVYVYDLDKQLIEEEFSFDYKAFQDSLHLNPKTHTMIAEYLHSYINEHKLLAK